MPRDELHQGASRPIYRGPLARELPAAQQKALARYHPALRRRLRRFALLSRPCADLLASFPAAATLIATMEAGPAATGLAVARVKGGAPLPAVADALELPLWTRKLPAEAFGSDPIGRVETSGDFARCIANHLPDPDEAWMWRAWVLEALRLGDERFALWVASQPIFHGAPLPPETLEPVAAYAFASHRAAARRDPALTKRWGPRQPFEKAARMAAQWLERVIHQRCAIDIASDAWSEPSSLGGYRFHPLTTAEELIAEGRAMDNCMATYVRAVSEGDCLIFSVRRGRRVVADLEIRPDGRPGGFHIVQFEGRGNSEPDPKVARAVDRWTRRLGDCPLSKSGLLRRGKLDARRWRAEWADFVRAHPAAGSLWREAAPDVALDLLAKRLDWLDRAAAKTWDDGSEVDDERPF